MQVFDHFCPWVGNSIGKGNRHIFLLFVCAMSIAIGLGYVVTLGRLNQLGFFSWGPRSTPAVHITGPVVWLMVWPICCIPLLFTLLGLAGSQLAQVREVTRCCVCGCARHSCVNRNAALHTLAMQHCAEIAAACLSVLNCRAIGHTAAMWLLWTLLSARRHTHSLRWCFAYTDAVCAACRRGKTSPQTRS